MPNADRPITLAVTDASTTMPNDWAAKSRRISSIAKNTPANGALKVAAIPLAVVFVALQKTVELGNGVRLQFRFESFNFFNHTQFDGVSTNLAASNFGVVTSARPARINQFGIPIGMTKTFIVQPALRGEPVFAITLLK